MNNVYDLLVELKANVTQFKAGMKEAQTSIKEFESVTGTRLDKVASTVTSTGSALTKGLTVPIAAAAVASVKAAMNMETAMAGVAKTTDLTAAELATMKSEIKGLSEEMPIAATEIAGVAEAAGQLGIQKENIMGFTETMVGLGTATDMSAEEAATALARLANITGMPQTEFDKLGSVIAELGNNMAATESEIVNMSLRLAGTGAQVGLTESQILGLSGAMTSMGINAEAGGSAMSQTMQHINTEVLGSGENLQALANIAGMTAQEFSDTWRNDPMKAIEQFVGGLGDVTASGGDVAGALEDAGISGLRQVDVLSRLSGGSSMLADAVDMSNRAWEENTALSEEVAAATATTASSFTILWNKIVNLAETIGSMLLPIVEQIVNKISEWVDWLSGLDQGTQQAILKAAMFAAALGPVLVIVGKIIGVVGGAITTITNLNEKFGLATKASSLLGKAGGLLSAKFIAIVAAIAAVVAAGVWLYQNWDLVKEKATQLGQWLSETWQNIKNWTMETWESISTAISEAVTNAYNAIIEWFGQIPNFFSELWASVIETVTGWAENMKAKAEEIKASFVDAIISYFGRMPESISDFLGIIIGDIIGWVLEMIVQAIKLGTEFVETVVKWFSQLPDRVWTWVQNTYNRVATWASNMWAKAKEMGSNFINAVISYFSQLPSRVWNWLVNTYNRVTTWAANMWTKAKETGSRFITNIISWFQQLPSRVQTWLTNTINRASNFVRDLGQKGLEAGRDFMNKLLDKAREIPGKIFNIGKDIVKGAWNGIKSMGNWIWGNVTDFFGGLVDGVKNRLSIFSPSRVFRDEIGKMIVQGFGLGIERNEDDAIDPIKHLIDSVVGAWDNVGALSTQVDGMVGHNVTQNVNMKNDYTGQPAYITLNIGGRVYKAFVEDITKAQDSSTHLELIYT